MDDDCPEILSSSEIYKGKQVDLIIDTIREKGRVHSREIILHPGSAVILAVDSDLSVFFVRQYRHATRKYLLELPAGSLEPGERPEETAVRELQEEVGQLAQNLEKLCEFFVSPGFLQEKMWLFLATGLTDAQQRLEDDEILDVVRLPFGDALERVSSGEIQDAKTIIGLLFAAPRINAPLLDVEYPAV
ncbi:MAG TPA: NUDIX hydrolase [Pyrinomonadaceae bacterium]|nr:NUDIX hydrolase [Pyrinomonadaceae bacterium]